MYTMIQGMKQKFTFFLPAVHGQYFAQTNSGYWIGTEEKR